MAASTAIAPVSFNVGLAKEMSGMPTQMAKAIDIIRRSRDNPDADLARLFELGGHRDNVGDTGFRDLVRAIFPISRTLARGARGFAQDVRRPALRQTKFGV